MLQVFDTRQAAEKRPQHLWSDLHVFPKKVCKRHLEIGLRAFMQRSEKQSVTMATARGCILKLVQEKAPLDYNVVTEQEETPRSMT